MARNSTATIESLEDYPDTPQGKQAYWQDELKGSQNMLQKWHQQADKIHRRYIGERSAQTTPDDTQNGARFKLNLFYSNIQVVFSLLYGRVPKVDVSRRYQDSKDDVGRVASVIMERLLNNDMTDNATQYDSVLRAVLEDRLVPGLGVVKMRYEVDTEMQVSAEVLGINGEVLVEESEEEGITDERVPTDYFHWRDVLWSWARTPAEVRWMGFRTHITKDEATQRYGKKVANALQYKKHKMVTDERSEEVNPSEDDDYWLKAEIWEIWCKETKHVYEFNFDAEKLLKNTADPLEIQGFFPAPPFFMANATTSLYKPTPDFAMTQDLYFEIDKLQSRIAVITEAVKVVGVYDAGMPEIKQMMKAGRNNDLIPVAKWAMFGEKGGLQGVIDWFPIGDIVAALLQLRQLRDETIELLYNITGMSDVMRGSLQNQYEGNEQTKDKVQFGSVRVQKLQEDFATFATNLMAIKASIIATKFDPDTIIRLSNAAQLQEDPELIAEAVKLIKNPKEARLRVIVKAESLALMDYTRAQAERTDFLVGMSGFMQAAAPLLEQEPSAAPYLMQLLQWAMAGFRGADEAEGILDKAIEASQAAAEEAKANPQPDPAAAAEQAKAQAQMQLEQMKQQGALQAEQAKTQATMQIREQDMHADVQTKQAEHDLKLAELQAAFQSASALIQMKAQADIMVEQQTSAINTEQQAAGVEAELNKDIVVHQMDLEKLSADHAAKIQQTRITASVKPTPTPSKGK